MSLYSRAFQATVTVNANIGYKLFVPNKYDPGRTWPILLFLHGIKKRGSDLSLLDGYGLLKAAEYAPDFEFIVLAPQCPAHVSWPAVRHEVLALLDGVMGEYNVDPDAVYLTGFSMGGNGTWDYAVRDDGRFAAVAPLAGYHEVEAMKELKLPVWAFHGIEDDTVPIDRSIELIEELRRTNAEVLFTRYPGLSHAIMEQTYANRELYRWLLSHRRTS